MRMATTAVVKPTAGGAAPLKLNERRKDEDDNWSPQEGPAQKWFLGA